MQLSINKIPNALSVQPIIRIQQPDKPDLEFRVTILNRLAVSADDPMREVNAYLATLHVDRQLAIYDLYRTLGIERGKIATVASEFKKILNFEEIQSWVENNLKTDSKFSVKVQYTQKQYHDLQVLGIAVKLLFPLMSLYGNNADKAIQVLELAGVNALSGYEHFMEMITDAVIGREVYNPFWAKFIFNSTLYRCLSVIELEPGDNRPNLVNLVWQYAYLRYQSIQR